METSQLRSFAGWARRVLVAAVGSRVGVVLGVGSDARVVASGAVAELEAAVSAAGGGEAGRSVVVDRVAYMWFNRLVALRFMDAAGVTSVPVVSPEPGGVQPGVLVAAKRGVFEDAVDARTRVRVSGLLDGSLQSPNRDEEAYAALLAAYCRHWNRAMPFLFERDADYTELLLPPDLLADGSVRAHAVEMMSPEVCRGVEVIGWLYQFYISERKEEVFKGFKKGNKAGAAEIPPATQLFTPDWIVRYLVENSLGRLWLLNHPSSSIRERMEYYIEPVDEETDVLKVGSPEELKVIDPACGSGHMLTYAFDLLYAIYEEEGYAQAEIPSLILTNNLFGTEIDPRAGALAAFALTMKARLRQRTFFSKQVIPNVCVLTPVRFTPEEMRELASPAANFQDEEAFWNVFADADTFGALLQPDQELIESLRAHLEANPTQDLIARELHERARLVLTQAEYLSQRYHVVVANPPYMGSGNMSAKLGDFATRVFPNSASGLDAMFIERTLTLIIGGGVCALITMQSWMFLPSYSALRQLLVRSTSIGNLLHLGTGLFPSFGGQVVAVAATVVVKQQNPRRRGTFMRLVGAASDSERLAEFRAATRDAAHPRRFDRSWADFQSVNGAPIIYFANERLAEFFKRPSLEGSVSAGVGSQTAANDRFVRYWFEVSSGTLNRTGRAGMDEQRWSLSTKGGEFRRWYNCTIHAMDWRGGGELIKRESPGAAIRNASLYFRQNLVWTKIGSKVPSFRFSDERVVHNDASCFIISDGRVSLDSVSAYLNSRTVASLMKDMNPTLNLTPGAFLRFPFIEVDAGLGRTCRLISEDDWRRQELSVDFKANELVVIQNSGALSEAIPALLHLREGQLRALIETEDEIEARVSAAMGLATHEAIPLSERSLTGNPVYRYGHGKTSAEYLTLANADAIRDLVSYAVGNMVGRFTLDRDGLLLADQGDTLETFMSRVPEPSFVPDLDNVIPVVDGDWFKDDIVARFREFLWVAFGEEHFEENLRFVEDTLGKSVRQYFVRDFYDDHWKRYKKRPIYWLFSSPRGAFSALIYMHRYTPSTVSTVLNEYVTPFISKLEAELDRQEHLATSGAGARDKAVAVRLTEKLRRDLVEVREWAREVLYPLAVQQIDIDLDDGVKANYPKFDGALRRIPGLEAPTE